MGNRNIRIQIGNPSNSTESERVQTGNPDEGRCLGRASTHAHRHPYFEREAISGYSVGEGLAPPAETVSGFVRIPRGGGAHLLANNSSRAETVSGTVRVPFVGTDVLSGPLMRFQKPFG